MGMSEPEKITFHTAWGLAKERRRSHYSLDTHADLG